MIAWGKMMRTEKWKDADRISDRIVDLLNAETKRPGFSALAILVGQLLAMKSTLQSAPADRPGELRILESAIDLCLASIIDESRSN